MPEEPTTAVFKVPLIAWLDSRIDACDISYGDEWDHVYAQGARDAYREAREWVKNA